MLFLGVGPAALNIALLFGLGVIVGAPRLLGRGLNLGFSVLSTVSFATPFVFGVGWMTGSWEGARLDRIPEADAGRLGVRA